MFKSEIIGNNKQHNKTFNSTISNNEKWNSFIEHIKMKFERNKRDSEAGISNIQDL